MFTKVLVSAEIPRSLAVSVQITLPISHWVEALDQLRKGNVLAYEARQVVDAINGAIDKYTKTVDYFHKSEDA